MGGKLGLVGSCRHEEDQALADGLKAHAKELDVPVEFYLNVPFPELVERICQAKVSIHTMVDEHFGINLLEFIAGGCVVISNRSGGPLDDIIGDDRTKGILCSTEEEYAEAMVEAYSNFDTPAIRLMRSNATESLGNFLNDDAFAKIFAEYVRKQL